MAGRRDAAQDGDAGGNSNVCLPFDDPADMTQKFDALAVGGEIAAGYLLWPKFGTVTDPYGVN